MTFKPTRRAVLAGLPAFALARSARADTRFARLAEPWVVAIMRHALAPGTGDPANFDVNNCLTQRNLDGRGRQQARDIGAAIRSAGIEDTEVYTSEWCRCRETAALLGLGEVTAVPFLNSFFEDQARRPEQTDALEAFLRSLPAASNAVLVTHQVNITALTGRGVASGEVFLLHIGVDGTIAVIDEILIAP